MKLNFLILILTFLVAGCKKPEENTVKDPEEDTVKDILIDFQGIHIVEIHKQTWTISSGVSDTTFTDTIQLIEENASLRFICNYYYTNLLLEYDTNINNQIVFKDPNGDPHHHYPYCEVYLSYLDDSIFAIRGAGGLGSSWNLNIKGKK